MSQHNEQYTPGLNRKRLLFSPTPIPKLIGRGKGTHCPGRTQVTANSPKRLEKSRGRGTRTCILILNSRVWLRAHSGQITARLSQSLCFVSVSSPTSCSLAPRASPEAAGPSAGAAAVPADRCRAALPGCRCWLHSAKITTLILRLHQFKGQSQTVFYSFENYSRTKCFSEWHNF